MKVAVFGMGYVGCVTAACLAEDGHEVRGVDIAPEKVNAVNQGNAPVDEPGLQELMAAGVRTGRLRATTRVAEALAGADVSLICVGTPSEPSGKVDLRYVARVCEEIGQQLRGRTAGHVVVVRSTAGPGAMRELVVPTLERFSGGRAGKDFHTAFNPEFLREGSAIRDYRNPPMVVIGSEDDQAVAAVLELYRNISAKVLRTPSGVAEMVKYVCNSWHALKIAFANEIGSLCRAAGVDSHAVMEVFLEDRQLNVSTAYLRPGFAFGGSCLPKDLRAMTHYARHRDVRLPVLENVDVSNQVIIEQAVTRITASGCRRVGLYGLSFKAKTDDLRESPLVILVERLIGKGIEVRIFDERIQLNQLTGANRAYVDRHLPHVKQLLLERMEGFDGFAELVVVGHKSEQITAWVNQRSSDVRVLDLVRLDGVTRMTNYEGASW